MYSLWVRIPLWQRVLAGFALGALAGWLAGPSAKDWFKPVGDLYISLIRMVVIPLLLTSIISSVANLHGVGGAARLGGKTIGYFILTAVFASLIGLGTALLLQPGLGLGQLALQDVKPKVIPGPLEVLLGVVPSNPFKAMADGNVLQVLFFALVIGAVLAVLGDKAATVRTFVNEANDVVMKVVKVALQLTPIGTFGLIAWVVGVYGAGALAPLAKYIVAVYVACAIHLVVVYGGLTWLHGLNPLKFFKGVAPATQVAFVTASSFATLPLTLSSTINRLGVAREYASFAVPLGASMKMDGCGAIFPAIAAVFIAQYTGVELSAGAYVAIFVTAVIGSLATAGVPGPSIVMLTLTLNAVGLPLEAIGYIIAVDRVVDMMRTATNVTGQALVPVLVARTEGLLNKDIYNGAYLTDDDSAPAAAAAKA